MAFCPFYNLQCPEVNDGEVGCAVWDTTTNSCGFRRQISLLQAIQMQGTDAIVSSPPTGKCKVTNIYWDDDLQKVVIEKSTEPEP